MQQDRTPNWNKWLPCYEVTVWEGVALSLDIDPDKVQHRPQEWDDEPHSFLESEDFNDRLLIVERNVGKPHLKHISIGPNRVDYRVALKDFVAWALSAKWEIPTQLAELAGPSDLLGWKGFDPDSNTYPRELDIALQAWRAVTNKPHASKTAKEQIRDWIEKHYAKELTAEAISRIAVVCNWEKRGGRPQRK